jgi:hypothetical protein
VCEGRRIEIGHRKRSHVGPHGRACSTECWLMYCRRMREHKHSSKRLLRYGSRSALSLSSGQQQMTQAAALSLIALLVAPAIVGAHSSRRLVQNRSRVVRKTAGKGQQMALSGVLYHVCGFSTGCLHPPSTQCMTGHRNLSREKSNQKSVQVKSVQVKKTAPVGRATYDMGVLYCCNNCAAHRMVQPAGHRL